MRNTFANEITNLASNNEEIILLSGDIEIKCLIISKNCTQ